MTQALILLLVLLAGMGLSVEAGLLGPLGEEVGHLWATLGIFSVGAALLSVGLVFGRPRLRMLFAQPRWQLLGGIIGPIYVITLTLATPRIGVGLTMVGILCGQVAASLQSNGVTPADGNPATMLKTMTKDVASWGRIVHDTGVQLD